MDQLAAKILASDAKFAISITGGGIQSIGELLGHGGASNNVIEVVIPYSQHSLQDYLKKEPKKYCSEETARYMATIARDRCFKSLGNKEGFGVGVTCSLARIKGERPDRHHEIHIAICSEKYTHSYSLSCEGRDREEEEFWAKRLVLEAIAFHAMSKNNDFIVIPNNLSRCKQNKSSPAWLSDNPIVEMSWGAPVNTNYIFPGSFNPIHAAHIKMCNYVFKKTNKKVNLEISLQNVDKLSIDHIEAEDRAKQIFLCNEKSINKVIFTQAPKFHQKVELFPNSTFLMGADTFSRIVSTPWDEIEKYEFIKIIKKNNCKFLIFDRKGTNLKEDNETLLDGFAKDICEFVPLDSYEDDGISSTKIRKNKNVIAN